MSGETPHLSRAPLIIMTDIQVLGAPSIGGRGREPKYLERKTAAFIAYLALEGSTAKQKLARLLWPESRDATARSNLRQARR